MTSGLSILALPITLPGDASDKVSSLLSVLLVEEFDLWVEDYAGAVVSIYRAGTTDLLPTYSDPFLTSEAANPQTLLTKVTSDGSQFGKFATSIYVNEAYELHISTGATTGVRHPPLIALDGQDASRATVIAEGTAIARTLEARFADMIHARDWGILSVSGANTQNTATIKAAIGAAAAAGGGEVLLPAGTFAINAITIPQGVTLRGRGRGITILSSTVDGPVVTLTGDRAALEDLTLDGITLVPDSVGIYSIALSEIYLSNVEVKRFETGIHHIGGEDHVYRRLHVLNCVDNVKLVGDTVLDGSRFSGLDWQDGSVQQATGVGLDLFMQHLPVEHNRISNVSFLDNIGSDAVRVYGARWTELDGCIWDGNIRNIKVEDNPDATLAEREVIGLLVNRGNMRDGPMFFDGLCLDCVFQRVEITTTTFFLTSPDNAILLIDCIEGSTTVSGETTKLMRDRTISDLPVIGQTADATVTTIWKRKIAPNSVIHFEIIVTGEQVNAEDRAAYHLSVAAYADPAQLAFDEQTVNFTSGRYIVGQTSGARAIIVNQSDAGATGTLELGDVQGEFQDNEIITEESGTGSAKVNGTLVLPSANVMGAAATIYSNESAGAAGWAVTVAALGQEFLVQVTGAGGDTVLWHGRVKETAI